MTQFLYTQSRSALIAEHWLRRLPTGVHVHLLVDPADSEWGRALQTRFPAVHAVSTTDENAHRVRDASDRGPRVTLALSIETTPLRLCSGVMPELSPLYPAVRSLWKGGFRLFEFTSLLGAVEFPIPNLLDAFEGKHKGQRAFVVGNGPSLNDIDMTRLADEITLGSNRGYLGFDKWGFTFPYWAVTDWLQIEEYGPEYEASIPAKTTAFFPFEYLPLLRFPAACPVPVSPSSAPAFSDSCDALFAGHSVTFVLIQLAAIMGCDPIILIGCDHRYDLRPAPMHRRAARFLRERLVAPLRGTPAYEAVRAWRRARLGAGGAGPKPRVDLWQAVDATAPTHFTSGYASGERKRFLVPEPRKAERDFEAAARWARRNGRQILNATPNSALEAFPKTGYASLFAG